MADLVIGLAKSVVEGALTKAQAAIEEEAKLRKSAQRDLVFITGEIEMMHAFLNVANEERVGNKVVRTWVRQVRELAYDVEDCIEFVVHLDTKTTWWLRFRSSLPRPHLMCMAEPPAPLPLDVAVAEIEQLKARVQDVSQRNARYNLISDSGSKSVIMHHQQPHQATAAAVMATAASNMLKEARDGNKKGPQQGFEDLTQLIVKQREDKGLQVISVWGACGDHGTTSIVRKAYNDPKIGIDFANRSWVKLMHPFNPDDLFGDAMVQFCANSCKEQDAAKVRMNVRAKMKDTRENLFKEFIDIVTNERYLLVLEGLSNMVEWDAIRVFLPQGQNGSRIIVTTQQSEVASLCVGHSYQIMELKRFSDEHSICALFKDFLDDEDIVKTLKRTVASRSFSYNETLSSDRKIPAEELMSCTLFGRESEINALREYPANARINPPSVMSVWGIAGVGKSALVKNLYDDLRVGNSGGNFKTYRWVDVSRPFNVRDFYQNLLQDFHPEKNPIEECHNLLKHGECLIVIDDLRSKEEWDLIQDSLVYKDSKSAIIVITTEASIARYCTKNKDLVFNVKALEEVAANVLFNLEVNKDSEEKELLLKCGGLPKVIAAVAGLLARKMDNRMDIVRSLNHRFMHHLETNPEYDSLRDLFSWMHSYFRTCPDDLKPCIFYLSIFPREQIIRRRRLVRRWIAEGYSRDGHNESAEDNGEKHFSELLELSIIQQPSQLVTTAFSDSRMVACQVNGFIREYIVSQRIGENLVFELGENCILTTQRTGRHLIILEIWKRDRIVFESMDFSRLRSLTVFGPWESYFMSPGMKMLRVLDLEDASGVTDGELEKMVKLFQRLKFLSLRGQREISHLPSSLGDLRQLQTLDVRGTSIVTLPDSISQLQKLQYIRAGTSNISASKPTASSSWLPKFRKPCRCLVAVVMHRGVGKLTALHTLGVVNVGASRGKAILEELKKLTQLRKLGVSGVNMKNNKDFQSAISGHVNLESLSVHLDKDNEGCLDGISLPCENLQSLKLYGLHDKFPLSSSHFSKLRKLDLEMATFGTNVMNFLANLPELCILHLRVKQLQDGELDFYAELCGLELDTFKKVKILEVTCSSGRLDISFGSKSMKNLELLKFDCSSASYQHTGLDDLHELKTVLLKGTNDKEIKRDYERQLANHPKTPVVKLEKVTPVVKVEKVTPAAKLEKVTPAAKLEKVTPVVKLEKVTSVGKMEKVTPAAKLEKVTSVGTIEKVTPAAKLEKVTPVGKMEKVSRPPSFLATTSSA
ncbi:unnamed protein product [Alopecurus aequalis]